MNKISGPDPAQWCGSFGSESASLLFMQQITDADFMLRNSIPARATCRRVWVRCSWQCRSRCTGPSACVGRGSCRRSGSSESSSPSYRTQAPPSMVIEWLLIFLFVKNWYFPAGLCSSNNVNNCLENSQKYLSWVFFLLRAYSYWVHCYHCCRVAYFPATFSEAVDKSYKWKRKFGSGPPPTLSQSIWKFSKTLFYLKQKSLLLPWILQKFYKVLTTGL